MSIEDEFEFSYSQNEEEIEGIEKAQIGKMNGKNNPARAYIAYHKLGAGMEAQTPTPQPECDCGVHPSVFYLLATLLLTSCSTAMLCAAMMTDHWEHVTWERAALAALANASDTALHWLLDGKVAKIEEANNRKGGDTFLVPMNGGIWTMCVSLEEEEVTILSRAGFPTEPLCTNYLANSEDEEARADWQHRFLIDFISGPVSVGFTSAAAIIIATTQVKDILGLSFPGGKFLQVWTGLYEHIGETRLWDTVLGISCIVVLLLLRKVKDIKVGPAEGPDGQDPEPRPDGSRLRVALAQSLWFLSTTRNILVVLVCAALAYYFDTKKQTPFVLTGEVKPGLPQLSPPPFSATVGNHTYTFMEMASTLGSAIFVVPLLSILENIALAKVFSEGKYVDATQEMLALGVCNIASALVESMPVSGALSRGAVNHASGVATPAGGLYTGALVLLALQYFTPYFFYIPKASLAAVIIAAVVFMMELHVFKPIWRTKKLDIIPAVVTFAACLLTRLELGIVIGIAVNLLFLLYASARPSVRVTSAVSSDGVPHVVATVDRALAFPSAEFVRRAVRKAAERDARAPLVLDASHVQAADFTAAKGIKSLIEDFHARGQTIIFYNVKPSIAEVFRGVRPREFLHCSCRAELDRLLLEAQRRAKQPLPC
ncbi:unnamed protein product, partial [Iphiclides podalirius]